jgi:spermidine dehydrogenase
MSGIEIVEYSDGVQTYPPAQTGVRGQQDGVFGTAHAMAFRGLKPSLDDAEVDASEPTYDLVVVGAGISGLSAAHFYKKKHGADKKILILDCLNDIGGHAKRNEFHVKNSDKVILGYGGSESFQSPKGNFSEVCSGLIKELGIDVTKFEGEGYFKTDTYPALGMSRGSFFAASEQYGAKDVLVTGDPTDMVADDLPKAKSNGRSLEAFFGDFPLDAASRAELIALWSAKTVTLGDMDAAARVAYLETTSYVAFLTEQWKIGAGALSYFIQRTLDFFGVAAQQVAALDAFYFGYPGFLGIEGLPENEEAAGDMTEPYIYHFPDGNATVARLLTRGLIPAAFPDVPASVPQSEVPEKLLLAKLQYDALDAAGDAPVKIRLGATAVNVTAGATAADAVQVGYQPLSGEGAVRKVSAKHCVIACFNMLIPYILHSKHPDESDDALAAKRVALKKNVKTPLVYTSVILRDWKAWQKLGVHEIFGVNTFHCRAKLDYPVSIGDYKHSADPSQPILVHLVHVPSKPETADMPSALRGARSSLFALSMDSYKEKIKEDLTKMLGPGGFDYDTDVLAITVNRWSHGYAYSGSTLVATAEAEEADRKLSAAPLADGTVTIANSDAAYAAYMHAAVDEAHRAVNQLCE